MSEPPELERFSFVLLRRDRRAHEFSDEELERLQEAHLAHLGEMGARGVMTVAGPFSEQPDKTWRGFCLYTAELEEARRLAESGEWETSRLAGPHSKPASGGLRPPPPLSQSSSDAAARRRASDSQPAAGSMRVLIAEDETIIRLDLKEILERAGFEVCAEARDGVEAVELAGSTNPDLAVLDVKMPRLDGIEAARRILEERPIPIVMLTAYGQDELVSRAVEAGVFGYLVKPFRETDLLPAVRAAQARHEELLTLREEADSLAEALAARKAIERAKGLLMEKEGISEQDAFARLRKASQVSGRPMKVVAEAVLATFEQDS